MSDLSSVKMSVSPVQKFREYLTTKGKRLTAEREFIVEQIFADHEHFDPEQLIVRLTAKTRANNKRVSRATIYRTMKSLEEAGLIRKVARANDREVYEHAYGYPQHDHLICERCGSLTEFQNQTIADALDTIAVAEGFRMKSHRLEVYGLCNECAKPPDRGRGKLNMV